MYTKVQLNTMTKRELQEICYQLDITNVYKKKHMIEAIMLHIKPKTECIICFECGIFCKICDTCIVNVCNSCFLKIEKCPLCYEPLDKIDNKEHGHDDIKETVCITTNVLDNLHNEEHAHDDTKETVCITTNACYEMYGNNVMRLSFIDSDLERFFDELDEHYIEASTVVYSYQGERAWDVYQLLLLSLEVFKVQRSDFFDCSIDNLHKHIHRAFTNLKEETANKSIHHSESKDCI